MRVRLSDEARGKGARQKEGEVEWERWREEGERRCV